MTDSAIAAKAQIVDKLRGANTVLVTVSANPSVDQLSACIAATMVLNKFKKNATAVFSGKVPGVLDFLKPGDTLQKTTDSLRDFIIALDKSKADSLRYKLEDDVVKIFITPYRTSITEKDLTYSAGEFNVDVILALGVQHQQDLDKAIVSHGRIFHDAVIMSINSKTGGDFGSANWEDLEASSLSELVASLTDELDPNLLDAPIATALLTGIVAETGRFSNANTHPRTMSISSRLLEAGADQKQVNTQLQELIGTVVDLHADDVKPTVAVSAAQPGVPKPTPPTSAGGRISHDVAASPTPTTPTPPAVSPAASGIPTPVSSSAAPSLTTPSFAPQAPAAPEPSPTAAAVPHADDADAARKAVENALGGNAPAGPPASAPTFDLSNYLPHQETPVTVQPPASPPPAPPIQPFTAPAMPQPTPLILSPTPPVPPQPTTVPAQTMQSFQPMQPPMPPTAQIQPISPNQPSYASPATTTQYDAPNITNEPAPLGMSPADQAFTMPLPPAGLMTAPEPTIIQPQFPQPQFQPPQPLSFQPAVSGPLPPPLPPPVMPPTFGR